MSQRPRQQAIDLVRGAIMVVMVLDHVRDFFHGSDINPRGVADHALFLTRWITHFCAPSFVFLAGVSAFFYGRGRSRAELSRFLATRGLWLVLLELTVVRFAVTFRVVPDVFNLQVIWAIGWSMVVLAALVFLPRWAIAVFAAALILGHNALDGVHEGGLWMLLHRRGSLGTFGGVEIFVSYPLVPWLGVLAAGYLVGEVFVRPLGERERLLRLGALALLALFVALRASGIYGDPTPAVAQEGALSTLLSFLNCEKYPPSLLYLCMTLGPTLLLLSVAESFRGPIAAWLVTLGRVPMFFYVAHLLLIHAVAVVYASCAGGDVGWLFRHIPPRHKPIGYGLPLGGVYVVWLAIVAALTPPCAWFAALKQRRREWWLSYL